MTDSYSLLKALYRNPGFIKNGIQIHVVANKVNSVQEGKLVYDKLESVVSQFLHGTLHYFGMIPQDAVIEKAVRQQKTVSLMACLLYTSLQRNGLQGIRRADLLIRICGSLRLCV